jgi:transcriptional regulator with XRE-family HTH domain
MRRELDLAGELSVTHQHVSRIELGDATESLAMLLKVNRRLSA